MDMNERAQTAATFALTAEMLVEDKLPYALLQELAQQFYSAHPNAGARDSRKVLHEGISEPEWVEGGYDVCFIADLVEWENAQRNIDGTREGNQRRAVLVAYYTGNLSNMLAAAEL